MKQVLKKIAYGKSYIGEISKAEFVKRALEWANTHSHLAYYQSNNIEYPHNGFREILAVGCQTTFLSNAGSVFEDLKSFHKKQWLFGYLGYDLKNEIERLSSQNKDYLSFADAQFFVPQHLIFFEKDSISFQSENKNLIEYILTFKAKKAEKNVMASPKSSVSKEEYLSVAKQLRQHIEAGDCYQINYCREFHGNYTSFDPVAAYLNLNAISPAPFSCLQKFGAHFIISSSPERFLKKTARRIISQPMKGTRSRGKNVEEDKRLKTELRNDKKEIAENRIIVDLVRNDLARTAKTGSVKVEEAFGTYSFAQVHQMISTITSVAQEDIHFADIIKHAFPMGSMTGAPKIKVMQLIEQYENTKRGAFSGTAGYISPEGDFDFNVLIRSLFVNSQAQTYSLQAGSAITYDSIPEQEYEECQLKAKALLLLIDSIQ